MYYWHIYTWICINPIYNIRIVHRIFHIIAVYLNYRIIVFPYFGKILFHLVLILLFYFKVLIYGLIRFVGKKII